MAMHSDVGSVFYVIFNRRGQNENSISHFSGQIVTVDPLKQI